MTYAPTLMRWAAYVAATFIGILSGTARAETRSLRVDYEAPPSCPDRQRFIELARDRVREWPAVEERGELVARARTELLDGVFVGRLSLEDATGRSLGERTIQEASCEDVVLALALFLGVALEADAAESRARPTETTPVIAPAAPPSTRPAGGVAPRDVSAAARLTLQIAARAQVVSGRMPDLAPGAALDVEVGLQRRASLVRPFASLGIDAAPDSTRHQGRGTVDFSWGAVFMRACLAFDFRGPDRRQGNASFEPWLCARAEGGALRAVSNDYTTNRTETLPWYAVGGETGVAFWPSDLFGVGGFVHVAAPIVRHELVLSEAPLFRVPLFTAEAGLELKVRIW